MTGYTRIGARPEIVIEWQPDDPHAATEALVAVDGTGVSSPDDLPDNGLVDLEGQPDVQDAVRDEYDELTAGATSE